MSESPLDTDRLTAASFAGTLAFGRLAIALAFAANAVGYYTSPGFLHGFGMLAGVLAAAAAYWAQLLFTQDHVKVGLRFMAGSLLGVAWSVIAFAIGAA